MLLVLLVLLQVLVPVLLYQRETDRNLAPVLRVVAQHQFCSWMAKNRR